MLVVLNNFKKSLLITNSSDLRSEVDRSKGSSPCSNIGIHLLFTPRCTIVHSGVLRLHVVRLSVCLSVCDVGGSGPHRLEILETNCTNN